MGSSAPTLVFDADGKLALDDRGRPIVDLSNTSAEQLRTLAVLESDRSGRLRLKLRDPVRYLEMLARNRGLLGDKVGPTALTAGGPARVYVISDRPMSDEELQRACVRAE